MSRSLISFAVSVAQDAGAIMRHHFRLGLKPDWKDDHTPVTQADLQINAIVLQAINETFPSHSLIAEEFGSPPTGSGYVWVCDPLDGTIPFAHGVPVSTFSLALTKDGESILGVIHDPFLGRMITAEKGSGAFLNGKALSVSQDASFSDSVLSITFRKKHLEFIEVQRKLMEEDASLINFRSFVYSGALVATGNVSAALFTEDMPWDAAALKVIVEEAGGKVTDLRGNEQRYDQPVNGVIASNGFIHQRLVQVVSETLQ